MGTVQEARFRHEAHQALRHGPWGQGEAEKSAMD